MDLQEAAEPQKKALHAGLCVCRCVCVGGGGCDWTVCMRSGMLDR